MPAAENSPPVGGSRGVYNAALFNCVVSSPGHYLATQRLGNILESPRTRLAGGSFDGLGKPKSIGDNGGAILCAGPLLDEVERCPYAISHLQAERCGKVLSLH